MKKTILLAVLLVLSCTPFGFAQQAPTQQKGHDDDVQSSTDILNNLDSLMNLWYLKNTTPAKTKRSTNIYGFRPDEVPSYNDSVYAARINKIMSPLPYTYNEKVKAFIDLYAVRKRPQVERMLGLSEFYFPIFEEVLDKYNMPLEIKYLSVVESALNPRALSKVGASGLWQFMYATGRLYRLDVNSYVDDRRDPYQATDAAARYLRDLHNIFGDWFLAIAAYNCGPGNINKAIRRSGGKHTFWEIYNYLPAETRGYVPAFIAASYVFMYHREHNLYPQRPDLPNMVDTVVMDHEISFASLSKALDLPIDVIRDLNPHFKKDYIPARSASFLVRLPAAKAYAFAEIKDSLFSPKEEAQEQLAENKTEDTTPAEQVALNTNTGSKPVAGKSKTTAAADTDADNTPAPKVTVWYTVKSGDYLSGVADWYDVSIYSIRRWNGLRSNSIGVGLKLKILVPQDKLAYYKKINGMTALQKRNLDKEALMASTLKAAPVAKDKTEVKTASVAPKKTTSPSRYEYYVVQKGDTLWSIAQRYPGVTVADIMRANGIKDNHSIKVGQKIKIQKT